MAYKAYHRRGSRLERIVKVLKFLDEKPRSARNLVGFMFREFGIKPGTSNEMISEMGQARLIKDVGHRIEISEIGKQMLKQHFHLTTI